MKWIQRLLQFFQKKKAENVKVFYKTIFNWQRKTQKQVYQALETEVEHLKRTHPGYRLKGFSKPIFLTNGGIMYKIAFKKI